MKALIREIFFKTKNYTGDFYIIRNMSFYLFYLKYYFYMIDVAVFLMLM